MTQANVVLHSGPEPPWSQASSDVTLSQSACHTITPSPAAGGSLGLSNMTLLSMSPFKFEFRIKGSEL